MTDSKELSRRRFLSVVASTAATSCLPLSLDAVLACESPPAMAEDGHIAISREALATEPVIVLNSGYRLLINSKTGSIVSFRSTFGVDRDLLISNHVRLPLLKMELMNDHSEFLTIDSLQAKVVTVRKNGEEAEPTITIEYKDIADLPIEARVTVRCPANETLTYWSLELMNGTTSWIGHIQFPLIEIPFDKLVDDDPSHILWSFADGGLASPVVPSMSIGPWGNNQRNTPELWRYNNYPGQWTSTQLMAYYNDAGGLYVACDDPSGLPKFIDPLIEEDGVTMGLGHYPGTRGPSTLKLSYNVVLGTFHGDWYAAAEIYRDWASKQPFCATKLAQRKDHPAWLTDSPVAIAFPMRGQGDWDPPAAVNAEYTPATNALPYLEKLAAGLECPLMPIVFNWEHGGPWVQPDAFPPLGGEAAMREFMARAKEKGWYPVLYGDGLSWVTWQKNTNYDGMAYFKSRDGKAAVARKWDGSLLEDVWAWRKNYVACLGTEKGRQMVLDMTRKMSELGPAVIQQFDQGPGPRACYAADHGHPPVPGPWMTAAFTGLIQADTKAARSTKAAVIMSCEGAPPESYLQDFQTWDARASMCPLYSFLYHEYGNGHQGFYTNRVSDEALRLSVARAIVNGYMVNVTLRDKGLIEYDWDQLWNRAIPDQVAIVDWIKRANQFRTGIARDYLVFGRMLRPWKVSNVMTRDFGWGKEPLVQSAIWQAPDGRIGIVLANYADLGESPRVELAVTGQKQLKLTIDGLETRRTVLLPTVIDIEMTPRSLALIEVQ
ncbi:DUF6259 domain-containing protein [Tunturibacter empetritectus]|uniref:DUF6259 domain-containing protein n=1 Tax=Tunturiibacter lichenicola TaxID=2051959 RepID=A0A7W8J8P6_9BACT|nr:DUF6259 domain-containing protein [Edaphobacter lichenicola]MBB5343364.1 hypothetical protein [Edaphobacter lichenicola]